MTQINVTLESEILHGLFTSNGKDDAFAKLLESILNQVLNAQVSEQIGADRYERSDDRLGYRNGFRMRSMTTRVGTIELQVPRLRDGNFSTTLFRQYQRSEQALVLAMMEMVINGVSTRKVSAITEELCGKQFSKSTISELCKNLDPVVDEFRNRKLDSKYPFIIVDALYTKVRENGRVRSKGLLLAIGVRDDGHREILGLCVADSESETSWSEFFESLKQRGLVDVDLIVSDNHGGLVNAIKKHFQGATWQRCQTHFSRNVLDKTPKRLQPEIKQCLTEIYNAPKLEIARSLRDEMLETYAQTAPKAMETLELGFDDVMAVMNLPKKYRKRLLTSNSIERLNQEIRRRERVIRIFPNEDSLIRLIGALLMEQDEKWTTGKKYLDMKEYHESRATQKSVVAA
ncbi:IS256 family transposase [Alkalibacter saccharofermentans]|uniref:Mutator family transposase n=1 Tax=Alkalibacter saccharofermentans DSM 14828 TaxID=1120975 RepID=A0A1M4UZ89_9FIRM|nr:IS256 family transposase [Alkalibacter saccharofermentans]SHE62061.1 Transposase (or an inactivated derivative) [Alkalibacter saccharofermentans DSM 14828]